MLRFVLLTKGSCDLVCGSSVDVQNKGVQCIAVYHIQNYILNTKNGKKVKAYTACARTLEIAQSRKKKVQGGWVCVQGAGGQIDGQC
jgi:hypothetical protein